MNLNYEYLEKKIPDINIQFFFQKNFSSLTHLTKLDLSKNELRELPEDFGDLSKLKYLDLYKNQLQHLPLSFSKLKDLKFLDLKDNPLVPAVAKIAGPCLDTKQCQSCAKDVVNFFVKLELQVNTEVEMRNKNRQKQLEINQHKKQEEKKANKKKERAQKQIKQAMPIVQRNGTSKQKAKKETDNRKSKGKSSKKGSEASVLGQIILTLLLTSLTLFILTSVKVKYTINVENLTREFFHSAVDKLPPSMKIYADQCGHFVHKAHNATGEITLGIIKYLDESIPKTTRDNIYDNVKNIIDACVIKIKNI